MTTGTIAEGSDALMDCIVAGDAAEAIGLYKEQFGHLWGIATHQRDVSQREMQTGATEWFRKMAA